MLVDKRYYYTTTSNFTLFTVLLMKGRYIETISNKAQGLERLSIKLDKRSQVRVHAI